MLIYNNLFMKIKNQQTDDPFEVVGFCQLSASSSGKMASKPGMNVARWLAQFSQVGEVNRHRVTSDHDCLA